MCCVPCAVACSREDRVGYRSYFVRMDHLAAVHSSLFEPIVSAESKIPVVNCPRHEEGISDIAFEL
jgi:hypothetical protein